MAPSRAQIKRFTVELSPHNRDNKEDLFVGLATYMSSLHTESEADDIGIDDDGKLSVHNSIQYSIKELEDGKLSIESKTFACYSAICTFLNEKGIHYELEFTMNLMFSEALEEIAVLHTKGSPFVTKADNSVGHSSTELGFTLRANNEDECHITMDTVLDSLESCTVAYASMQENSIVIPSEDILSIEFTEYSDIKFHIQSMIDWFTIAEYETLEDLLR